MEGVQIMLKKLSVLLTLGFLYLPSAYSQGRAPAVEPEMGISIDEYTEVHSGPEKGFDFTQANPGVSAAIVKQQARGLTGQNQLPSNVQARNPNSYAPKERAPAPIWTLLALTALPFGLWLLLRQTFPKDVGPMTNHAHPEGPEAITIDLASEREKRKSFEDDEDKSTKVS